MGFVFSPVGCGLVVEMFVDVVRVRVFGGQIEFGQGETNWPLLIIETYAWIITPFKSRPIEGLWKKITAFGLGRLLMLRTFNIDQGRLRRMSIEADSGPDVLQNAVWVDLHDATEAEKQVVTSIADTEIPDASEVEEIEASSRNYKDDSGIHINSLFLYQAEGRNQTATVAFNMTDSHLITSRDAHIPVFRLMRMRTRLSRVFVEKPLDILLALFEYKVDQLADSLEDLYKELEEVSRSVLKEEGDELEDAVDGLAVAEDTNGKIRLCLMDTQRSASFLARQVTTQVETREKLREILRDVDSLLQHTTFVFDKVNFLMDAAQGFINIEQNRIIKIFSIAAVVFLPPTVVASVYGMNFKVMPELSWTLGYPLALLIMVMSGLAPYLYFKTKGLL